MSILSSVVLTGCDAGSAQTDSATARLVLAENTSIASPSVIQVKPESASNRTWSNLLTAKLRSEEGTVSLQRIAVGIHATASLSSVLDDAVLAYKGSRYPLDQIVSRTDSTGFLIFQLPAEGAVVTTDSAQALKLLAQFKAGGHNERVRVEIDAAAKRKIVAEQNGFNLTDDQKLGLVCGQQYRLKRIGAHLTTESVTAKQSSQIIRFKANMKISAVGSSISFPWQTHRIKDQSTAYPDTGLHYLVENSSGEHLSGGSIQSTTLESTAVVSATANPLSQLTMNKSEERTLTLSVRYRPEQSASKQCFRLAALKYQMSSEETHLLKVSDAHHCVRS